MLHISLFGLLFNLKLLVSCHDDFSSKKLVLFDDQIKLKPNYKVREIEILTEPTSECPVGFTRDENNCKQVFIEPASKICTEGWRMNGESKCIGFSQSSKEIICKTGELIGTSCITNTTMPAELFCPNDSHFDEDKLKCLITEYIDPIFECPAESTKISDFCLKFFEGPILQRCPLGYSIKNNFCFQELSEEPLTLCPETYILDGTICKKNFVIDAKIKCNTGNLTADGECLIEEIQDPISICENGILIDDHHCEIDVHTTPLYECKIGLKFNNLTHQCEGRSIVDAIPECSSTTDFYGKSGKCHNSRSKKITRSACPPNYNFFNKDQCSKIISEPGQKVCPPHFKLISKDLCSMKKLTKPIYNCHGDSFQHSGACIKQFTEKPVEYCDVNQILINGKCHFKKLRNPKLECSHDAYISDNGRCVKFNRIEPKYECTEGYNLKNSDNDYKCIKEMKIDKIMYCPDNFVIEGGTCKKSALIEPNLDCPKPYFFDKRIEACTLMEKVEPIEICPLGYQFTMNSCLKQLVKDPIDACNDGYILNQENLCIKIVHSEFIVKCPIGFDYDEIKRQCIFKEFEYQFDHPSQADNNKPKEKLLDLKMPDIKKNPDNTEKNKDLNAPIETKTTTAAPIIPTTSLIVERPVVQKGLIQDNQKILLQGPIDQVTKNKLLIEAGKSIESLTDVTIL